MTDLSRDLPLSASLPRVRRLHLPRLSLGAWFRALAAAVEAYRAAQASAYGTALGLGSGQPQRRPDDY